MSGTGNRDYGSSGIPVSPLCVGTSSWGLRGSEDNAARWIRIRELAVAVSTMRASTGINFVDTSNQYSDGAAEGLIGHILAEGIWDVPGTVIQTKLDRDPDTGDFSAARMWTSVEESLDRLGVTSVPVLFIHDPENTTFDFAMSAGGPVSALVAMKEQGLTANIGVSGGPAWLMQKFVETDVFDTLINHNRWTLLDRSADGLFDAATSRGLGITNAAPFGGGILTGDARFASRYAYAPASAATRSAAAAMAAICRSAGVPLAAAALQFSQRDPRVHSTVVGMSSAARLLETQQLADVAIPDEVWDALEAVAPDESAWLG